jgi:hypothetical protein
MAVPVMAEGLGYRFTEANDHYSRGVKGVSNTFAGALWALDFLHGWATHAASGVDFHNTQWVVNDIITPGADGQLSVTTKGCGITAFEIGGHGRVEPLAMANPDGLNLTAYAVSEGKRAFVTVINMEHGGGRHDATVTFDFKGLTARGAAVMMLSVADGDAASIKGVTLGGAAITSNAPWCGKWEPANAGATGRPVIAVTATSAAVVRFEVDGQ